MIILSRVCPSFDDRCSGLCMRCSEKQHVQVALELHWCLVISCFFPFFILSFFSFMDKIMYTREELLASAKTWHGDKRLIPAELLELPNQQGWWAKGACNSSLDLPFQQVDANNEWCIPRHNRREEVLSGYWTIAVRLRPFFLYWGSFHASPLLLLVFSRSCVWH